MQLLIFKDVISCSDFCFQFSCCHTLAGGDCAGNRAQQYYGTDSISACGLPQEFTLLVCWNCRWESCILQNCGYESQQKGFQIQLPPQYKLVHGHVVKVGKSAVSIEYGNFSGEHERRSNSGHRGNFVSSNSHDQYQKECVYVWSDRSAVLFPKGRNNFEVIALEGHNFPVEQSTRSPFSPLSYILYVNISFFCALCSGLYMTL
jgi:hypothetical protein